MFKGEGIFGVRVFNGEGVYERGRVRVRCLRVRVCKG